MTDKGEIQAEDVVLIGLTHMSKILVQRGDSEEVLNRICANNVVVPVIDTPLEVGLGFAVDFKKPGGFIGKEALIEQKKAGDLKRRLVQFLIEYPEPILYGSEPIFRDGVWVDDLGAGSYGHILGGAVGLGADENEDGATTAFIKIGSYEIEVEGVRYPARASLRPMFDPKGLKVRS